MGKHTPEPWERPYHAPDAKIGPAREHVWGMDGRCKHCGIDRFSQSGLRDGQGCTKRTHDTQADADLDFCLECHGTGKKTRLGGDWGKTPDTEIPCWACDGEGTGGSETRRAWAQRHQESA